MPYIKDSERARLVSGDLPSTPGELNYCISIQLVRYLQSQQLSYRTINDVLGALEGAKQEFYRRVAVNYEAAKQLENGDIYDVTRQIG
jgi:hypothetical protein